MTSLHPSDATLGVLSQHAKSPRSLHVPRLMQVQLGSQCFTLQHDLPYVIGSGPTANIEVADATLPPRAATILNDSLVVHEGPIGLNGRSLAPSSQAITLRDGDQLQVGTALMKLVQLSLEASAGQNQSLHPSHAQQSHEQQASQAIQSRGSPSNSTILGGRVREKEDGVERTRYSGVPYDGRAFADEDLDKISPPVQHGATKQLDRVVRPGHATALQSGGVVVAGTRPVDVHEARLPVPAGAVTHVLGSNMVGSHHKVRHPSTHEVHGLDEPAQKPIAVIPAGQVQQAPVPVKETHPTPIPAVAPINQRPIQEQAGAKYSTSELTQIMRDMLELSSQPISLEANDAIPHMLVQFPHRFRQTMGSPELKRWLRAAETERELRASQSQVQGGATAGLKDQLNEHDLAYGMLALMSEEHQVTAGDLTSQSSQQPKYQTSELQQIFSDMTDISGDSVASGVRERLPAMFNHLPKGYRNSFDSQTLKQWIKRTHDLREEKHRGLGTPSSKDRKIGELDLIYSLVGLPWMTSRHSEQSSTSSIRH